MIRLLNLVAIQNYSIQFSLLFYSIINSFLLLWKNVLSLQVILKILSNSITTVYTHESKGKA